MIFIQVYVRNALKILLSKKWCFLIFSFFCVRVREATVLGTFLYYFFKLAKSAF